MSKIIFGWFGKNNLGDDILLKAYLSLNPSNNKILTFGNDNVKIGLSNNYIYCRNRFIFYLKFFIAVFKGNQIVFAGGSVFRAVSFSTKITLSVKIFLIFISKLLDKNIELYSVSIGPANSFLIYLLSKLLSKKDKIMLRDSHSKELLLNNNKNLKVDVIEDSSSIISYPKKTVTLGKSLIALNLSGSFQHTNFKEKFDEGIILVSLCENKEISDKNKVLTYAKKNNIKIIDQILYDGDINKFFLKLSKIDFLYAERLHACLIAKHMNILYEPIGTSDKVKRFIKEGLL